MISGNLINDIGSAAQKDSLLAGITQGTTLATLAHQEPGARYNTNHVAATARKDGNGWSLSGHKAVVLAAASANTLLVSARTSGGAFDANGISLFVVDPKAAGVTIRPYGTQDGQRAADVILKDVKLGADALVGAVDQALPAIEHALDRGIAALCAEAVGVMSTLNAQTLEYLKNRKQFDQPIGKFQVLQHRMADMAMAAEYARAMALLAAVKVDEKDAADRRRHVLPPGLPANRRARWPGCCRCRGMVSLLIVAPLQRSRDQRHLRDVDHHWAFSDSLLAA